MNANPIRLALVLALAIWGLAACAGARQMAGALASRVDVETSNIPYHGTVLAIDNQADDEVSVLIDGGASGSYKVPAGGTLPLTFYDFSGGSGQHSVLVKNSKGSTSRSVYVSGSSQSSDTWTVHQSDLQR